jgi:hypothetical protein
MPTLTCSTCKVVTPHSHAGHFRVPGFASEAKVVYACSACGTQRVWGSVSLDLVKLHERDAVLGPRVPYISNWMEDCNISVGGENGNRD